MRFVRRLRALVWRSRPTSPTERQEWKARLRVGLCGVIAGFLLHMAVHITGFFERYDEADADHYAQTFPLDSDWSRHITIVEITDADYRGKLFRSQSPLNPEALMSLVSAVQSYRPNVIRLGHPNRLAISWDGCRCAPSSPRLGPRWFG